MSYQIGAESGYDDLPHFWVNRIRADNHRFECMCITERDFTLMCALEGRKNLKFPGKDLIAKIACVFNHALRNEGGLVSLDSIGSAHKPGALFALRAMEKKLVGLRSVGDVFIRIIIALNFVIFTSNIPNFMVWSLSVFSTFALGIYSVGPGAITSPLIGVGIGFHDPMLIPTSHTGRLVLFPIVTSYFLSVSEKLYFAFLMTIPIFALSIFSNHISTYSLTRWVARCYYVLYYILLLTTYVSIIRHLEILQAILALMVLEQSMTLSLLNGLMLVSVFIFAFTLDILRIIRRRLVIKVLMSGLVGGVLFACSRFMSDSGRKILTWICVALLTVFWAPALPDKISAFVARLCLTILNNIEWMYYCWQAVKSAILIFQTSPVLAGRWLIYRMTATDKQVTLN
jgi:hypothetical protein